MFLSHEAIQCRSWAAHSTQWFRYLESFLSSKSSDYTWQLEKKEWRVMGMFYGPAWKRCISQPPVLAWPELSWKEFWPCLAARILRNMVSIYVWKKKKNNLIANSHFLLLGMDSENRRLNLRTQLYNSW